MHCTAKNMHVPKEKCALCAKLHMRLMQQDACCRWCALTLLRECSTGMDDIHGIMGCCPQHDLLWPSLTGQEHLEFYARIKGLSGVLL